MSDTPTDYGRRINRTMANDVYPLKREACATCRFWLPDQDHGDGSDGEGPVKPTDDNIGFGYCRRRPPVIVNVLADLNVTRPRYGQQIDADDGFTAVATFDSTSYPGTFHSQWCGDFEWLPSLAPFNGI